MGRVYLKVEQGEQESMPSSPVIRVIRRGLTGVNAFVRVEAGLLREALETQVALEGTLACVRAHVDFQVRLAAERCVANLFASKQTKYTTCLDKSWAQWERV